MHVSSGEKIALLRRAYLAACEDKPLSILDVGSAVIGPQPAMNRAALANPLWSYCGLDIAPGRNVDVVVGDPYDWSALEDASVDLVTCTQVFEHTEFFWLSMLEIARVMKPLGLLFLIAPSAGPLHRYPHDCWRFYEDGFPALAKWAGLTQIESRVQRRPVYSDGNVWRDAALVAQRPAREAADEALFARRVAHARAALTGEFVEPATTFPEPSLIGAVESRDALARREEELLSEKSLGYKFMPMDRHRRRMFKVLRTPIAKLVDQ